MVSGTGRETNRECFEGKPFSKSTVFLILRRLWEPCVSKHIYGERLEQSIQIFNETGTQLRKEMDCLQLRHDRQLSRLRFFEQALEYSRERLKLDDWNYPSRLNLTELPDGAREGRTVLSHF